MTTSGLMFPKVVFIRGESPSIQVYGSVTGRIRERRSPMDEHQFIFVRQDFDEVPADKARGTDDDNFHWASSLQYLPCNCRRACAFMRSIHGFILLIRTRNNRACIRDVQDSSPVHCTGYWSS